MGRRHAADRRELVIRASAAGLAVSCRFSGSDGGLPDGAADAACRVVQERLTNALKHAPSALVDIRVDYATNHVEISVRNGPAAGPPSGLERTGGGRGLASMRERIAACGDGPAASPLDGGGWPVDSSSRLSPPPPPSAEPARSWCRPPAPAPASATHIVSFTSVQEAVHNYSQTVTSQQDTDVHKAGKIVGFDLLPHVNNRVRPNIGTRADHPADGAVSPRAATNSAIASATAPGARRGR